MPPRMGPGGGGFRPPGGGRPGFVPPGGGFRPGGGMRRPMRPPGGGGGGHHGHHGHHGGGGLPPYFAQPGWAGGPWGWGYGTYGGPGYVVVPDEDPCQRLVADRDRAAMRDAPANAIAALREARALGSRCDCPPVLEQRAGKWSLVHYGARCAGPPGMVKGVPVIYDAQSPLSGTWDTFKRGLAWEAFKQSRTMQVAAVAALAVVGYLAYRVMR